MPEGVNMGHQGNWLMVIKFEGGKLPPSTNTKTKLDLTKLTEIFANLN